MRYLVPIIIITVAVGIFFTVSDPLYNGIKETRKEIVKLDEALARSKQILALRDSLLLKYNNILPQDLEKVEKLLPKTIDNVRLILEVSRIAIQNGVALQGVNVVGSSELGGETGILGPDEKLHGTIGLSFTLVGKYDAFRNFLGDLERSLHMVDVVSLGFNTQGAELINQYNVLVQSYWLK